MKQTDLLLSIFNEINEINSVMLTGSFSLYLQGIVLRRIPTDLDICTDKPIEDILMPKGCVEINVSEDEEYETEIRQFLYKGIKIDLLPRAKKNGESMEHWISKDKYIHLLDAIYILQYKLRFSLSRNESAIKHREDLIFILKNN